MDLPCRLVQRNEIEWESQASGVLASCRRCKDSVTDLCVPCSAIKRKKSAVGAYWYDAQDARKVSALYRSCESTWDRTWRTEKSSWGSNDAKYARGAKGIFGLTFSSVESTWSSCHVTLLFDSFRWYTEKAFLWRKILLESLRFWYRIAATVNHRQGRGSRFSLAERRLISAQHTSSVRSRKSD